MGMTNDKTIEFFNGLECHTPQAKDARDTAVDTMRKYQMFQADYEKRLREDVVAMLDEIRLQAEEDIENPYEADHDNILMLSEHNAFADCFGQYNDLIEDKINALKGDSND